MPDRAGVPEAEVISQLAQSAAAPHPLVSETPLAFLVPNGEARIEIVDPDRFQDQPRRTQGTYTLADIPSLIGYGKEHAAGSITTVWVDQLKASVVVVFNDADGESSGWRDHRAKCDLLRTPEWEHWLKGNGKLMDQQAFAEHIEDGLLEITEPASADMLEIAQSIRGKTEATWRSASRLDNGAVGFQYIEEVQATAGRQGNMEIPSVFNLGLAPFYGEEVYELTARLRYRVREGNLTIGYKIERPDTVELSVMKAVIARLRDEGGFDRVYLGTPAG